MTASLYDLQYTTPSPQERVKALMQQVLKRRKAVSPNPADGFLTTGTGADSDAEGAGDATTAPGSSQTQQ